MSGNTQTAFFTGTFFTLSSIRFLSAFNLNYQPWSLFFVTASDYGDVVATCLTHEEDGNACATSFFVMRETAPQWHVAVYRLLYPNSLHARRFGSMFSDGRNSPMYDRMMVHRDTDIGCWNRRRESSRQWFAGIIDPTSRTGMQFVHHENEVPHVCTLLCILSGTEDDWRSKKNYKLINRPNPYNKCYLVKDVDDWNCKLDFERYQKTNPKECRYRMDQSRGCVTRS